MKRPRLVLRVSALPRGLTEVLRLGGSLFGILFRSLRTGRLPQRLLAAERQQALYTWQLSQMLPAATPSRS